MEFIKQILHTGSQSGDEEQSQSDYNKDGWHASPLSLDKEEQYSQSSDQNKEGGHVFSMSLDDIRAGNYTKLPLGPGKGSIFLPELPPEEDTNLRLELSKLMDGDVKIMTRLREQLKRPLPKAIVLLELEDVLAGAQHQLFPGTDVGLFLEKRFLPGDLVILGDIENMQFMHPEFQLRTSELEKEKEFLMSRVGDITQDMDFKQLQRPVDKNTLKYYDGAKKLLAD